MKKTLLILTMLVLIVCVLVISASASIIYKDDSGNTLFVGIDEDSNRIFESYEGGFPSTDENGNALTWYITNTENTDGDTVHTVESFLTVDTTNEHASLTEAGVYKYVNQAKELSIVSAYFPDNSNILTFSFSDSGYGSTYNFDTDKSNILFLRLPNTLTALPSRICQSTPIILCDFHKDSIFTKLGDTVFYDCRNLREIFIPDSICEIGGQDSYVNYGSAFYNCISLTNVEFENVDADFVVNDDETNNGLVLKGGTFAKCTSLEKIVLPNRTVSVGPRAFELANSLVEIRFGSALKESFGVSIVHMCPSMKYYYVPSTWTTVCHHSFSIDAGYGPNDRVFFYAGTKEQFEVFLNSAKASGSNQRLTDIKAENILEWDSVKGEQYYKDLATTNKTGYVVYGYSPCDAFYNKNHNENTTMEYTNYLDSGLKTTKCTRDNCNHSDITDLKPLFEFVGYSSNDSGEMCVTYRIDTNAIQEYKSFYGEALDFSYGIIVAANNNNPLSTEENVVKVDLSENKYTQIDFRLSGLSESTKDVPIAMNMYAIEVRGENTAVKYVTSNSTSDIAEAITYATLPKK